MQTIIHITDLHHTVAGVKKDISKAFISLACKSLSQLRASGELGADPILVFTGDFVQMGGIANGVSELDSFKEEVLKPLQRSIGIHADKIILVPGNHEIDISSVPASEYLKINSNPSIDNIKDDLRTKLHHYFKFIERNDYHSVTRTEPRVRHLKIGDTALTLFNGMAGIYSDKDNHNDHGSAFVTGPEAALLLQNVQPNSLFCTHHPLEWYEETSRAGLQAVLSSTKSRFICGHEHQSACSAVENKGAEFVKIYGGASGTNGRNTSFSIIHLSPDSAAIAKREVKWSVGETAFVATNVKDTVCCPAKSVSYFKRTRAFLDKGDVGRIRENLAEYQENIYSTQVDIKQEDFISPPISFYRSGNSKSNLAVPSDLIENPNRISLLSGNGLSGKSTLLLWVSTKANRDAYGPVAIYLDAREFRDCTIEAAVISKLRSMGANIDEAAFIMSTENTLVLLDNVRLGKSSTEEKVSNYLETHKSTRTIIGLSGGTKYSPAIAPKVMPSNTDYYLIDDITVPKAMKLVQSLYPNLDNKKAGEIVGKSFKALTNIGVHRTNYYLRPILEQLSKRPNLDPLNRYLLQQRVIEDVLAKQYEAHPTEEIFDPTMFNMFMGRLAHMLWKQKKATFTEFELHTVLNGFREFIEATGDYFDYHTVKSILLSTSIIRRFDDEYGFLVPGVEDYFLAKHIEENSDFGDYVLSKEGLLELPAIAQLYIAANPHDKDTIERIFEFIDELAEELKPLRDKVDEISRDAISNAKRKSAPSNADELIEELKWLRKGEESKDLHLSDAPATVGTGYRVKYQPQDAAAIYLQLGASIISLARTLGSPERKKLFARLRPLLEMSLLATPMLAEHIAQGGSVTLRGVKVSADYVGVLKDEDERFYIILREMLSANARSFGFWAGSQSFYGSMRALLLDEKDPLIRFTMISQQIEANVSQAREHASNTSDLLKYPVLIDGTTNHFIETLRLQSIQDKNIEQNLIADLANEKAKITAEATKSRGKDIKKRKRAEIAAFYKAEINKTIGISTAIGNRFVKPVKK